MASTDLQFVAQTNNAALFADNTTNPSYYFLWNSTPIPTSLTVQEAWNNAGSFIFSTMPIGDPTQFIPEFQTFLSKFPTSDRFISWVLDPDDVSTSMFGNKNTIPMVAGETSDQNVVQNANGGNITFGNLRLGIPQKAVLTLSKTGEFPQINAIYGDEGFPFNIGWAVPNVNLNTITLTPAGMDIQLGGTNNGQCLFATQPKEGDFYQLFANETKSSQAPPSAEMRYTFGQPEAVSTLRYPIFTGVNPQIPSNKTKLNLLGAVDPLQATNSERTYFNFNFDDRNPDIFTVPTCRFFNNTVGATLTLSPSNGSGFALGLRPATNDTTTDYLYLLPKGNFQVTQKGKGDTDLLQVLCGTNSTEFLIIAEGDYLTFATNNSPGSAPDFSTTGTTTANDVNLLTDATTSAYLGLVPGANQASAFANIPFKESYCVQSEGLVFFHEVSGAYYSAVIGCRLADLSTPGGQSPFPMVPYGGIYTEVPQQAFNNPNQTVQGSVFEQFETKVIQPNRRAIIQPDLCLGPLFFDLLSPTLDPITGYVLTAEGLLVELNDGSNANAPAGTWNQLILAKSPINADQYIKIGACDNCGECGGGDQYEVVNTHLSNALMSNVPMIVITKDQFGGVGGQSAFTNELQMDEFTFEINLDRNDSLQEGETPTILLFKLDTNLSVKELSQMPSLWGYPEYFISENEDTINAIGQDIYNTIQDAENTKGKQRIWFEDFIQKMTDPAWTGVIALNCSLDYQDLPIDIQMLLGGIQGQLMAHHFGVTDNNIENNFSGDEIPIENSSLFALVYYNHPQPTAYSDGLNHFETLILNALFKNSVLTNFQARIAMTIPRLFEETASLTQYQSKNNEWVAVTPPIAGQNIIEIDGVYQAPEDPNGIGKVVFDSEDHFVFTFPSSQLRVLDQVVITDASLVPITEVGTANCETQVTSYFEMVGGIGFVDAIGLDPNNNHGNIDVFSFAANPAYTQKGLGLRGYNFEITTCINGNEATLIDGIPTLYDEIQTFLQKDGNSVQARDGSLYATFPLALVNFMYNLEGGLTPESLQGKTMVGIGTDAINVGSSSTYPPVLSDVNPNFAFQFQINVGSLGALVSDDNILNAEIVLGWTISGSTPSDDKPNKVAMIFQPPDGISLDGSFKIEGVFNSVYGDVVLDLYPYNSDEGSPLLYVITLMDVNFNILSLQLLPKTYGLTLFGNPVLGTNGNSQASNSNNLTWFTGNPTHKSDPGKPDYSNIGVTFIYQPLMGLMSALEINTAATGELTINVIGPTITKLISLPIITQSFINDISTGQESIVNYNPNSQILLWFDMTFASVNVQGIFNDPSFYGGALKIGPPSKKNGNGNGNGNGTKNSDASLPAKTDSDNGDDNKTGIMDILGGLEIVFVYRKISDSLGVYAVELVLPDKFRKFTIGGFGIELPSVGLEIFTNGDFKVEIGWPFSSTNSFAPAGTQFKVTVPVYPPPLQIEFFAGFYFAKLRSEDAPSVFAGSDFSLIYMFGIGVGVGLGVSKDWAVISFSATLSIWTTMEGMLASEKGVITNDGIDYYWFAGQVGITLNLQGKVNLGIISASLEFEATLVLGLAIERYHKSLLTAQFQIKIEFKVKVAFFTIKFRFSFELTLFTFTLGPDNSPPAELSGPSSPFSPAELQAYQNTNTAKVQRSAAIFEEAQLVEASTITPVALGIYFTMQPTAVYNSSKSAFLSNAVASMVISIDDFTTLVQQTMPYLVSQYGGGSLTDQMNNILANISTIEANAIDIMGVLFTVQVAAGSSVTADMDVGVFALPPGLEMTYNGNTINFDATQASADYLQTVQDYFNQLAEEDYVNPNQAAASTVPVTEILFENYFGLIVQGTAQTIVSNIQNGATYTTLSEALSPDNFDYDSLSGSVSRYLQAGLQLPEPSDASKLAPMYLLTNQQVEIAFTTGDNPAPVLEFDLQTQASVPAWLSLDLADGQTSLKETMDASLVFNDPTVNDNWTDNAAALDAIIPFTNLFQFTTSQQWTDAAATAWNLRPFSDDLNQFLANATESAIASLTLKQIPGANEPVDAVESLPGVPGSPALLIKFKLQLIPTIASNITENDGTGTYLSNVYQVVGTDDTTRDLIQEVLDLNDLSIIKSIDLLTASSGSDYATGSAYANGLMVRTNLSTDSEAPDDAASFADVMARDGLTAISDLGPLQASLQQSDALNFLRLLWECSIVNTQGFYLQIDGIDQSLFGGTTEAGVSLLVQFNNNGTGGEVLLPYPAYYNLLVLNNDQADNTVAAYLQNQNGDIQVVYQPNINAGNTGFTVNTTTMATPSVQDNPEDYLDYIYQFLQYKVNSVSGESNFQPTNWSIPNGATSEDIGNDQLLWNFRQSIPVYYILGLSNPYDAVGKTIQVSVRMLDMFGNALPNQWSEGLTVEYNDALIPPGQWQGMGTNYLVEDNAGQPQLSVSFVYQPGDIKSNDQSQDGTPSQLQQTIAKYTKIKNQLDDKNVTVSVSTVLAAGSFSQDAANQGLATQLATFVGQILNYLQNDVPAPSGITLNFQLEKTYISTLSSDIIQLEVNLEIARDPSKVNTSISDVFAEVLSVNTPISAYVADTSDSGDQSGVVPFAQAFEAAYLSFAGANTWVKIAQGPKMQSATGATTRALFAVRWGENAGIHVAFPNTGNRPETSEQPVYFAPTPLSTVLLNATFDNLYQYDSNGTNPTAVKRSFSNVDLDKWGRFFLSQLTLILTPPLATSIAEISADFYKTFIGAKESLAETITDEVQSILDYTSFTPDGSAASDAFEQALLGSLNKDYSTSAIIQLPATVSTKGQVSSPPPQLFGKVAENNTNDGQIYTLSSGRLDAANETEQFAFLASAKRPETDAFLNFNDLNFNIGFVQYQFEESEAKYGFVPSTWLTFVLPDGAPLQQALGPIQTPIPLRSFPPTPVLLSQKQVKPQTAATTITESLLWTYELQLGKPVAEQDQLYFTINFNEPVLSATVAESFLAKMASGRPVPKSLFEALARFVYEYPQLAPHLQNIVDVANGSGNAENADTVLKELIELVQGVSQTWKSWQNPAISQLGNADALPDESVNVISWGYSLINQSSGTASTIQLSRASTICPWPELANYTGAKVANNALERNYTQNDPSQNSKNLTMSFANLYILTHQSVNVVAYIKRNDDLVPSNAPVGTTVDNAFVYVTESVTFPSLLVPLNQNDSAIAVSDEGSLAATLEGLFDNFIADPNNPQEQLSELRFALYAESSFTLATNNSTQADNTVDAGAPILYSGETVATPTNTSGTPPLAMNDYIDNHLAPAIQNWEDEVAAESSAGTVYLAMTIYSNVSKTQLPLVIYSELDLPTDD